MYPFINLIHDTKKKKYERRTQSGRYSIIQLEQLIKFRSVRKFKSQVIHQLHIQYNITKHFFIHIHIFFLKKNNYYLFNKMEFAQIFHF